MCPCSQNRHRGTSPGREVWPSLASAPRADLHASSKIFCDTPPASTPVGRRVPVRPGVWGQAVSVAAVCHTGRISTRGSQDCLRLGNGGVIINTISHKLSLYNQAEYHFI